MSDPEQQGQAERVWFLGHATTVIEVDGRRFVTDPLLRGRVSMLMRRHPIPAAELTHHIDAVLISHMHQDHLDLRSLAQLGTDVPLLVPPRAGAFLRRRGFRRVAELGVGDWAEFGSVRVQAVRAKHTGFRPPFGPLGGCLGFVVAGALRVYFAGDTDLFAEMAALGPVDVALLPVAGWGPTLGPGHMDAVGAAHALRLIRPRVAVPIHWGTFAPVGLHLHRWRYLHEPPLAFRRAAQQLAPAVDVRVLEPGEVLEIARPGAAPAGRAGADGDIDGPGPTPHVAPGISSPALS